MPRIRETLLAVAAAVLLTFVFWLPLWFGGGFVGGDVYSYYLPQKLFYAERLQDGELPLWHAWTGFGYPLLGESQTGVFYPPNPLLYGALSVNTAYNAAFLAHYVLAFVFTWLLARRFGIGIAGAALTAVVFVYGWFPPRNCWEWAIVTGCWLPAAAWCAESYLQSRRLRYAVGLSLVLGVQLLAGHYHLAFVTHLTLLTYVPLRLWFAPGTSTPAGRTANDERSVIRAGEQSRRHSVLRPAGVLFGATALAYALAAPQLLPSWELKQNSQRDEADASGDFDPAEGHLPPTYLSQVVLPWFWYTGDTDAKLAAAELGAVDAGTNKVEAHLYFGLLPLMLAVWGFVAPRFGFEPYDRRVLIWLVPGLLAVVYATGWLLPVFRHVPGFAFFRGPGRYGIATTLAVALLAGASLSQILSRMPRGTGIAVAVLVLAVTICDLFLVSRLVRYSIVVPTPIVSLREHSEVRRILHASRESPRLLAPMPNMPNLLGVSALPVYLGIGPREYFEDWPELPNPSAAGRDGFVHATPEQIAWLQNAGVTHVLAFHDLALTDWPARRVWFGRDRFLNSAYGRPGGNLFLYEFRDAKPRASLVREDGESTPAEIVAHAANSVTVHVDAPRGGRLVLRELAAPGWRVTVDGEPAQPLVVDRYFRGVAVPPGEHVVAWRYRPRTLSAGIMVAGLALLVLAIAAWAGLRWNTVAATPSRRERAR